MTEHRRVGGTMPSATGRPCAIVTGSTRGIGHATVRKLAAREIDVVLTGRTVSPQLDLLATEIAAEFGVTTLALPYSLSAPSSADDLIAAVMAWSGRLDILVANAGIWNGGRIDQLDEESRWQLVEINLRGTQRIAEAALPALRASKGSIVLVSSIVGLVGFSGDTAYAAAKAGIIGFGRSLAKEVARQGVRVNILAPGFVSTEMTSQVPCKARARISDRILLGRFGSVDEVARAAAFLAVDATYCTGTVLTVDGGWSL